MKLFYFKSNQMMIVMTIFQKNLNYNVLMLKSIVMYFQNFGILILNKCIRQIKYLVRLFIHWKQNNKFIHC